MTYPFPPDRIDPHAWICPGAFAALLVLSLVWAVRRPKGTRFIVVALAIAATLWFLLMLPRFQALPELNHRTQCKVNLNQIGTGIYDWHAEHGRLPEAVTVAQGEQPVSWRITLLPYLVPEHAGLVAGYDPTRNWDDTANLAVARRHPVPYVCPTNPRPKDGAGRYFTAYALMTGPGTPLPPDGPLTLTEITDDQAETLLVGEACGLGIVWTEPGDTNVSADEIGINRPGPAQDRSAGILSSYHVGGTHILLADGRVRFLSQNVDERTLRALTTASAGDTAGDF
jgi:hypothetical protein